MYVLKSRVGRWLLLGVSVGAFCVSSAQQPADPTPPLTQTAPLSEAERIVALQRLIEMDQARLVELKADSQEIAGAFDRLSSQLGQLDEALVEARARVEGARGVGTPAIGAPTAIAEVEAEVARLEAEREKVRAEFDLVIERRKAIDRQLTIIPAKLEIEQQGLERLTQAAPGRRISTDPLDAAAVPAVLEPEQGSSSEAEPKSAAAIAGPVFDPVVADARKALESAEEELRSGEERARLLDRALDLFQADLAMTQEMLVSERREAALAAEARESLTQRLEALNATGASAAELAAVNQELKDAEARTERPQQKVGRYADRHALITAQVNQLQQTYEESVEALRTLNAQSEQALELLAFVQSPLSPHRMAQWMMREGVVILVVLALMALLWALAQMLARRVVMTLARRGHRGSEREREERAQTLKRVFQSVTGIAIIALGGLAILDQVGIDVTVLLGGAAVFGMAVAFGAQALVKDYFSGFIMLMENQYRVGNVVRIGEISGTVEDVTLRMTVLRDMEGVAHFIPHGQIATVSNLTHGWSRVVFDIGVAYGENVDHVMEVLVGLAREMRKDPAFSPFILDDAEMLGVDAFGESAVSIKFRIRTQPLQQWAVKRELLRRIKHEFDAQGIEIPFPHRTVYHRKFEDDLAVRVGDRPAPDALARDDALPHRQT